MSNITLNIVEPGSGPIDPVVPNTGLFTSGIGGPEATIIVTSTALLLLTIISILVMFLYKKHKKQNKTTRLVHLVDNTKAIIKSKKRVTASLTALALLASAGTFSALLSTANKNNTSALEGEEETITPVVSSEELTIELSDEPVFAILPVDITVEQATEAGYTLTAYTDNTDLVSTTDESKVIPMVAVDEGELAALTDNTYGLSPTEPASQAEEAYTALSTDTDNPTLLAEKEEGTEADDTTTIYYGFYITPDTPYGTYTSGDVHYDVEEKLGLATVTYDGNGLTFDGGLATNVVKYEQGVTNVTELYSHTPNVNNEGVQTEEMYPLNLNKTFVYEFADAAEVKLHLVYMRPDGNCDANMDQYFSFWKGSHANYTAIKDWESGEKVSGSNGKYPFSGWAQYTGMEATVADSALTLAYTTSDHRGGYCGNSGYGYYATITATNAEGQPAYAIGNVEIEGEGEYKVPTSTMEGYTFLGWSTDPNATSAAYTNASDIAVNLPLSEGEKVTLYAVWSPAAFTINYDGNGNTAGGMVSDSTTLSHSDVVLGTKVDLYAPNYKKDGYGFAGWSIDADAWTHLTDDDTTNDPTIYGPNQTISPNMDMAKSTLETKSATLYAVWVPAEKNNGTPVTLQGWTGCGNLVATTYDVETGKLSVGANTITALTDSRDGEVYTVAKLADGNCWTVENLRMANTHIENGQSTTTAITTNNTNNPLNAGGNVTIMNNDGTATNHLSPTNNRWCTNTQEACLNQSYLNTNNTNMNGVGMVARYNGGGTTSQWYAYGNNYNWYSATAGRGTWSVESGTVTGDICPTGWHLPYGGDSTDESGGFSYLYNRAGANARPWRSFPNNFVYSGRWDGLSAFDRGNWGYYWSSAAYDPSSAYGLYFISDFVGQNNDYGKIIGYSVRCVAQ